MQGKVDKKKLAVVLLAYADFESLEISLAAYSKFLAKDVKFYILQNGRGTYDCERTYSVAKRYEKLFPNNITVVDWINPGNPYKSIRTLLKSKDFEQYDYICKVDDDVFPLRADWLDKLINCYEESYKQYGDDLAYVTPLVNNNPWGFKETLEIFNLIDEYFTSYGREHIVGSPVNDIEEPQQLIPADKIYTGWCGTVWGNAYISRWLHHKTTMVPEKFITLTEDKGFKPVNQNQRYSINCMLFKKDFWEVINDGATDDEFMCFKYCMNNNKRIIADLSNPFIHLFFFSQRDENKDLIFEIRNKYTEFLNLPYPVSLCPNKDYENENRLRFLERCGNFSSVRGVETPIMQTKYKFAERIFSIKNRHDKKHKSLTVLGVKFNFKRPLKEKVKI